MGRAQDVAASANGGCCSVSCLCDVVGAGVTFETLVLAGTTEHVFEDVQDSEPSINGCSSVDCLCEAVNAGVTANIFDSSCGTFINCPAPGGPPSPVQTCAS